MDGSQWSRGWNFVVHAIAAFQKYPSLVLPILIVWLVYAPSVLYVKFYFHWNRHSTLDLLVFAFFFIAFLSLLILIACDVLLELIKQMEEDTPSLRSAVAATFRKDLINILPLAMTWAFIWFALLLLEALLSRRDDDDSDDPQLSAQSAAEAIADFGSFSLSRAFIQALEKGVRMVVFLILPAIAWEDMNFVEAAQKGLIVLKTHLGEFARGYAVRPDVRGRRRGLSASCDRFRTRNPPPSHGSPGALSRCGMGGHDTLLRAGLEFQPLP